MVMVVGFSLFLSDAAKPVICTWVPFPWGPTFVVVGLETVCVVSWNLKLTEISLGIESLSEMIGCPNTLSARTYWGFGPTKVAPNVALPSVQLTAI